MQVWTRGLPDLMLKNLGIKDKLQEVDLLNCWASSRLDSLFRFEWFCKSNHDPSLPAEVDEHSHKVEGRDFAGYPCKTFLHNDTHHGYWISAPIYKL